MGCNRRQLVGLGLAVLLLPADRSWAGAYLDYAMGLAAQPPDGAQYRSDLEERLVALLNAYRAEKGKDAVTPDLAFHDAARAHAADMMLHGFMGHTASTGHSFQGRMSAFVGDVTKYPSLGENAARDTQETPVDEAKLRALFQQWVESRSHRKNMVSRDYRFVSTGVIQKGDNIWAVQIFFGTPRKKGLFQ